MVFPKIFFVVLIVAALAACTGSTLLLLGIFLKDLKDKKIW